MKPVLVLPLLALGFLLGVYDWSFLSPSPKETSAPALARDADTGFVLAALAQPVEIDGYRLTWSNPRYENDTQMQMTAFKVDVKLEKHNQDSVVQPIFNCDIVDGGELIKAGGGVIFSGYHDLEELADQFTVSVPLEIDYSAKGQTFSLDDEPLFPNRRVSACRYTPTGSYDPNLAVEIRF